MKTEQRDNNLDLLRTIGMLAIILAHVSPPSLIMQLRTFDVPLIVIVSGTAFAISRKKSSAAYFYRQRILRLLAPTWSFLMIFFLYFFVVDLVTDYQYVSTEVVLKSFLFINKGGIAYMWIIKVFVLVAISTPLIDCVDKRINNSAAYCFWIVILMAGYFLLEEYIRAMAASDADGYLTIILTQYVVYIIPYSLLFAIGLRLPRLSHMQTVLLSGLLLSVFTGLVNLDSEITFSDINLYKYPPQPLWIIYGLMISVGLYFATRFLNIKNSVIYFISSSSIWIYLWHIFLLKNWGYGISHIPGIAKNYFLKFLIITALASFITYIQKITLNYILEKVEMPDCMKSYISIGFLK